MPDILLLILATLGGMALSLPMVGGLWWTLRRLPHARWPALFALTSFWARLALTVAGLFLLTAGDWRRGVAALLGFVLGRTLLLRTLGGPVSDPTPKGA